jgi:hypothetical protein
MTDRSALEPPRPTETFGDYVARLRADLTALSSERATPVTPQQLAVINRWIALIERELAQLGETPI